MSAANNSIQPSTKNDPKSSFDVSESRLGNYYKDAVTQTLERFLACIKYSIFKTKFPEIFKDKDQDCKDLTIQLVNQLKSSIISDVKILSAETSVFSSLKSLDDMIATQKDRAGEDSWRPSGNPENDVRDHIHFLKQKHKKCLEFVMQTYIAENNKIETDIEQNHAEILKLKDEVDNDNQEVQSNFASVNALDFQKLRTDIHTLFGKH